MRIPRSTLFDPSRNSVYAVTAVALSMFVFAYSSLLGPASILAYYGVWLPLLLLEPRTIIGRPRDLLLPGAFVLVVLASTIWSASPPATLRSAVQFATHVLCILVAARVVDLRSFSLGVLAGTALVVLYSLLFGFSAYDLLDGSYTFVGAFESKNQLGLFCSVGILFALIALITLGGSLLLRAAILLLTLVLILVLESSRSATSFVALGVAALSFFWLVALLRFPRTFRAYVLLLLLPASLVIAAFALQFGAVEAVLSFFGKDTTLTGRTYLWDIGLKAFFQSPLLGVGYGAYWVHFNPGAEMLWKEFYIDSRSGFHFHHAVIQSLVDVGIVGTIPIFAIMVAVLIRSLVNIVYRRSSLDAGMFAIAVLLAVRTFSEVDFLYQYSLGSFLLFYAHLSASQDRLNNSGSTRPLQKNCRDGLAR